MEPLDLSYGSFMKKTKTHGYEEDFYFDRPTIMRQDSFGNSDDFIIKSS